MLETVYIKHCSPGLTSILLTEGQMSGKKVLSLLVYIDVMKVDSLSVSPFKIIHKIGLVNLCL